MSFIDKIRDAEEKQYTAQMLRENIHDEFESLKLTCSHQRERISSLEKTISEVVAEVKVSAQFIHSFINHLDFFKTIISGFIPHQPHHINTIQLFLK